jgi:hypothetical protein
VLFGQSLADTAVVPVVVSAIVLLVGGLSRGEGLVDDAIEVVLLTGS